MINNKEDATQLILMIGLIIAIGIIVFLGTSYINQSKDLTNYKIDGALTMNRFALSDKLTQDTNATPQQLQIYERDFVKQYYQIARQYDDPNINQGINEWIQLDNQMQNNWMDMNFDARQKLYHDYQNKMKEIDDKIYDVMIPRYESLQNELIYNYAKDSNN